MSNMLKENELELSRFGEYLLKSRIVTEKHAPYYVGWVRRFMSQVPEKTGVTLEDRITAFLDNIGHVVAPWQIDQADKAVRLYFSHYLALPESAQALTQIQPDAAGRISRIELMSATRELIRLRHYSHSTEQTYLGWMDRFFGYLAGTGENTGSTDLVK